MNIRRLRSVILLIAILFIHTCMYFSITPNEEIAVILLCPFWFWPWDTVCLSALPTAAAQASALCIVC